MLKSILILYQYFYPDDVVSALQKTQLAQHLASMGWEVETWPCNRSCHRHGEEFTVDSERHAGVEIHRVWRPDWRQHSFMGRILSAIWVLISWSARLLIVTRYQPSVILIGTDPIFSLIIAPWFKLIRPKSKIVHWCFDMYPEYPIADGIISKTGWIARITTFVMGRAYKACDLIGDLGPCMKKLLGKYPGKRYATLTPWALEEPEGPLEIDIHERRTVFGEPRDVKLGLLYSGNFGPPHSSDLTVALARELRNTSIVFAFSIRGSKVSALKNTLNADDTNVRFVPFAEHDKLKARLSSPDIHIVTLREAYTGALVPSKFFGAIAAGRPVLFEGSEECAIAQWINEYGIGWVLTRSNLTKVAEDLLAFSGDSQRKNIMFHHCKAIYEEHFSKRIVLENWDKELKALFI